MRRPQASDIREKPDATTSEGITLEACIEANANEKVFAAIDEDLKTRLVVKLPAGERGAAIERVKREYRAIRAFCHPAIATAERLIPVDDRYAMVARRLNTKSLIEFVRGETAEGTLPNMTRLREVASTLVAGLAHIHALGWVHGDISAEAVMFDDADRAKWTRFGNAHCFNQVPWFPKPVTLPTISAYSAPELIVAAATDPSADMFAFGRLLAYMIAGRMPIWLPNVGPQAQDDSIRKQLPRETPAALAELCGKLVRITSVQRPSAEAVYEQLSSRTIGSATDTKLPVDALKALAEDATEKAERGLGSMLSLTFDCRDSGELKSLFASVPSDDPRLILAGRCDPDERTLLSGFDSLVDELAAWFSQLSPRLRSNWQTFQDPSLRDVLPALSAALGDQNNVNAKSHPAGNVEIMQAAAVVLKILTELANERTVVLIVHRVDQLSGAGKWLFDQLVEATHENAIILVTSTKTE